MPKDDLSKTINVRSNGSNGATPIGNYTLADNVDRVDGFHAFSSPRPNALLALDSSGKIPLAALPAAGVGQATGHFGVQYVGPTAYLAEPLAAAGQSLVVTAPIYTLNDYGVIGWIEGNEHIQFTTGPSQEGPYYRYGIARALRTTAARSFPAYATVVGLGAAGTGGHILMDSASDADSPLIKLRSNGADGTFTWQGQFGRLGTLPQAFKDLWDADTDWANTWGLATETAYLSGNINAKGGNIVGDLRLTGKLSTASGFGRAGTVLGNTEAGYGFTLSDSQGEPLFWAVSPYRDGDQILSEVAVGIKAEGKRLFYLHKDEATDEYKLEIGVETLVDGTLRAANILAGTGTYPGAFTGMRFGAEGLQSYGTDFLEQVNLDVQDGRLYFGGREGWLDRQGMTIDGRLMEDRDEFEHTIQWLNSSDYSSDFVGAAIGSRSGEWFATARRRLLDLGEVGAQAIDDFYEAGLSLKPGATSTWYGQTMHLSADDRVLVQVGGGQASVFERTRATLPALSVAGQLIHTTVDGSTVGMGTQATDSKARLVIEQDERPGLWVGRGDQNLSVQLLAYVPQGQQSTLPGGYVMRANSTIGISDYANASADYNAVQDWLYSRGLQPYTPQLAELANQNIATQYDDGTLGLDWAQAAIDEVLKFPHPMIFDYGEYWYKTSPNALTWTIGGSPFTQDAMSLAELTEVLANTKAWFAAQGIFSPWIMIDEPPHGTAPDWTIDIENRVIKFAAAAKAAGFTVGVAVPGPTQLAYWRTRLTPNRWILAAKHNRNEYATTLPSAEIWLYNRTNKAAGKPMAGLAQQMRDFGAVGYLHWSANSDVGTWPLVTCYSSGGGLIVTPTDYGTQLLEELRLFGETDVPPVQPVYEQWISSSGNLVLSPLGGYVLGPVGAPISLGRADRPWKHVYAQHLHGALGSQVALAAGSAMYISAYAPVLGVGLEIGNIVGYFEQSNLPAGKFLRAVNPESDSWEVIKVLSTGRVAGDWWEYDVERGLDGIEQYWPAGTTWVDLGGNELDGYVRMWGADDENPDTGPAIGIWQRDNDDAYDSTSIRFTAGQLNGFYDFTSNAWGLAAGRYTGKWFSVTDGSGLRIMDANTQRAVYREYAQIGNPLANNVLITDSSLQLGTGSTYTISMDAAGDMDLTGTLAVATGGAITWAGGEGTLNDSGITQSSDGSHFELHFSASYLVRVTNSTSNRPAITSIQTADWANIYAKSYNATGSSAAVLAQTDNGIAVRAYVNGSGTALQIDGGIVNGGSQRYTALGDATAATDALNRQTGDGRYALIATGRRWRQWLEA